MSYRDNEDAIRARVEALEAQAGLAAQEHAELSEELAQARLDLSALKEEAAKPLAPRWMFALGAVSTGVLLSCTALRLVSLPLVGPLRVGVAVACAVGLGLGLLGLARASGSRLVRAAAVLSFVKAGVSLAVYLLYMFGAWSGPGIMSWMVFIASDVVTAVALLKIPMAPVGLRKACGVLLLVEAGLSLMTLTAVGLSYSSLVPAMWHAPTMVHLAANVTLTALFFVLYKTAGQRTAA